MVKGTGAYSPRGVCRARRPVLKTGVFRQGRASEVARAMEAVQSVRKTLSDFCVSGNQEERGFSDGRSMLPISTGKSSTSPPCPDRPANPSSPSRDKFRDLFPLPDHVKSSRSISRSVSKVERGVHGHAEASKRRAALQAISSVTVRRYATSPLALTHDKV